MTTAYVGLGANIGDPQANVRAAMDALADAPHTHVIARSPLYRTRPWGMPDQPDFINAVVTLETTLSARELLAELHVLETRAGRTRDGVRWGPRTLDLDLLVYGRDTVDEEGLHVPHPRLAERAFVLLPLADVADELDVPGMGPVSRLLDRVDTAGCRRLDPD